MTDARCQWCGEPMAASRRGGQERRFCSPAHRGDFHTAARLYTQAMIDAKLLTVATLREWLSKAVHAAESGEENKEGDRAA